MIEIKNLSKKYYGSDKYAVENLTLNIPEGQIYGFLGPNGAGKSTTIKCITGILPITEGSVSVEGFDVKTQPVLAKRNVGYVSDDHAVYDKFTGMEYINFMADVYDVSLADRKQRAQELLKQFGLEDAVNDSIKTYSHGMKQKICIIGALISSPKVWILDEPMTGLDPQSAFELKRLMRKHCEEGKTVFFSSHVLEVVEKICDRVAIISGGKLVAEGSIEELKAMQGDSTLEEVFLGITESDTTAQ